MLTDAQAKLVILGLLTCVLLAGLWGFVTALRTGEVGVGTYPSGLHRETVYRRKQPGRYWRLMLGWAFALLVGAGLYVIPLRFM